MSLTETVQADLSTLTNSLSDLADEIDGVADFGMTVCFNKEAEMAGRHRYMVQRCEKIRLLADAIVAAMKEAASLHAQELSTLQADLVAGIDLLLDAFQTLERFRSLRPDVVRASAEAFRTGWETVHRVIREIAEALHLLDSAWFIPILERQDSYRSQLGQVCSCFYEEAAGFHAEQSLTESETAERPFQEP